MNPLSTIKHIPGCYYIKALQSTWTDTRALQTSNVILNISQESPEPRNTYKLTPCGKERVWNRVLDLQLCPAWLHCWVPSHLTIPLWHSSFLSCGLSWRRKRVSKYSVIFLSSKRTHPANQLNSSFVINTRQGHLKSILLGFVFFLPEWKELFYLWGFMFHYFIGIDFFAI